ncbi:cobalamin biosynthesis protein [Methanobrevibacter millerae]|uniref:Probable cobalamin biosynthesis protein CobD n=1 Tax=Methanobrevibacter millerae TaxID=230361 RepID=A0A1G5WDE2_9EURY|nr:cobalamin biosynthesis protein [Methanobrevibacter millerae]SDA56141.1 adenosylcobinamide-phosphate synthase [Methanobrevibacter millerae]
MFEVFLFIVVTLIVSLAIDLIFGELPTKIHPVVIIGKIIEKFKSMFIAMKNRLSGFLTTTFTIIVSCLILLIIMLISSINDYLFIIVYSIMLSSTYSIKMLLSTAKNIENDLTEDIEIARKSVSYLVSRDTDELTESFIVSATIESMTENITDSYIAPIFYFTIAAVLFIIFDINYFIILLFIPFIYRISNTLDAMLGYKTDELINIGYFPAKLDDVLNYVPSRVSGLFVVLSAYILRYNGKNAYRIMRRDARKCPSPNSGYTMAPTAGALDIQLVKKDTYILGDNTHEINVSDISKAIKLTSLTIGLFTIFILIIMTIFYLII